MEIIAAGSALGRVASRAATGTYAVGVGHSADPYAATRLAITASGEFPATAILNRSVVIKVNLVVGRGATTGVTTDPQVTRAVVDLCLQKGASKIFIVDGSANLLPNFGPCGYNFFTTYDPQGRISLVDLVQDQITDVPVPGGYTYSTLWLPVSVVASTPVFISIAKLKTHCYSWASLTTKNLVGLAPPSKYQSPGTLPRTEIHNRGLDYSIADLNLARPIHYAVVDGVIALEGEGPVNGTPREMDLVLAGRNAVAVDLVGADVMGLRWPNMPLHLRYLADRGRGPNSLAEVQVNGYQYTPAAFEQPSLIPATLILGPCNPNRFGAGQTTAFSFNLWTSSNVRVEIAQDNDITPGMSTVTVLQEEQFLNAGSYQFVWDGHDASGIYVKPGVYLARAVTLVPGTGLFNSPTSRVKFLG